MASLEESPRSQKNDKNLTVNHDSCSSISSSYNSFASIDDEFVNADDEANHQKQVAALCEKWLQDQNLEYQEDIQLAIARLLPDFDQMGTMSISSINTEECEVYDSLVVTRRRRGNLFDPTDEPEPSAENEVEIESNTIQQNDTKDEQ